MNTTRYITIALAGIAITQIWLFMKVYQTDNRIAYIDTGKLMQGSKQMQALKNQLKGEQEKVKANVDTLNMEFQNSLKAYEKTMSKMTEKEKELSKQLLQSKQNQLMQYQQAIEQKVMGDEQKKTQEILTSINAYITEYGISKNYKIVFATAGGNIAYGDKGIDITDDIIKGVNGQ